MKIKLDLRKDAQGNASHYFELAKSIAKKIEGAKEALRKTQEELEKAASLRKDEKIEPKMKRKKEWYEKYHWFFTSGKRLVLAGRDAAQNDHLVASVMTDGDLFFHADIQGAPATILVDGKNASEQEKKEAAQFAASHSSAWKIGAAAVDVYCVQKSQLSKTAHKGYVGKGAFAIEGKREWFHKTQLALAIGLDGKRVLCLPACHKDAQTMPIVIYPGGAEKGQAARQIAKLLGAEYEEVLAILPSGNMTIR
ncbi:MAG: NFACT RNA binding domain-containing protein [Candidatus Micrarchaeota archaeon]|nr:NFACT RNA binding domain-containing protein [Candidatus Micrarchaeota archaeon]